jgi:hypothetical protein
MGLTIHYCIEAGKDWTRRQIRQKLEDTRRFALSLPVVSVSEVVEFRGKDCDYQANEREGETPDEAEARDPYRWAKIQAGRYVESPWRPGESQQQAPSHMMCRFALDFLDALGSASISPPGSMATPGAPVWSGDVSVVPPVEPQCRGCSRHSPRSACGGNDALARIPSESTPRQFWRLACHHHAE